MRCGILVATAGIALRRAGIAVQIAELRADVADQPGVGLSLQSNCIAALGRLSLAAACIEAGMAASYINLRRPDGGLIAHQPVLQTGGPDYPGTAGIARKPLHQNLLQGALEAGVTIRFGSAFKSAVDGTLGSEFGRSLRRGRYLSHLIGGRLPLPS